MPVLHRLRRQATAEPALAYKQPQTYEDPVISPRIRQYHSSPGMILRDGTSYLARDYWLEAGKLVCVTWTGTHHLLPLRGWIWVRPFALTGNATSSFVILCAIVNEP